MDLPKIFANVFKIVTCGVFATLLLHALGATKPAYAQRGGFGPDRVFEWLDSNKDGRLSTEEAQQARGPIQGTVVKMVEQSRGSISRDDFIRTFDQEMTKLREAGGESGRDRGRDGGEGDRSRSWDRGREEPRPSESRPAESKPTPKKAIPPRPKVNVILPLQDDFKAGDLNRDHQLSFAEWRQWSGHTVSDFEQHDANQDGYVTSSEIALFKKGLSSKTATARTIAPRAITPVPTPAAAPTNQTPLPASPVPTPPTVLAPTARTPVAVTPSLASAPPMPPEVVEKLRQDAKRQFSLLDANQDGTLALEELGASRRWKSAFDRQGVAAEQLATEAQFVEQFVRLQARR